MDRPIIGENGWNSFRLGGFHFSIKMHILYINNIKCFYMSQIVFDSSHSGTSRARDEHEPSHELNPLVNEPSQNIICSVRLAHLPALRVGFGSDPGETRLKPDLR